jgi:2-oxoglutarate dehydrogenase E1 component
MGPWRYIRSRFGERMLGKYPVSVVSRPESASPATGSAHTHRLEEQRLMDAAFA